MQISAAPERLNELPLTKMTEGIRTGVFTSEDVVRQCLARIAEREPTVRAWSSLPSTAAEFPAPQTTSRTAPLYGVPFGVKDVIDTREFPTTMGSAIYDKYQSLTDAGCVSQLRSAGAIPLGKTTTCEFAGVEATVTTNPHDPTRTPGGSSSGSAAAVADCMVPFALGTQTGGSIIRPASFCGIVGFKPTYGLYSISGVKLAAPSFDTIGILARTVADALLVHQVLMNSPVQASERNTRPRIGLLRTGCWEQLETSGARAFERAIARLDRTGYSIIDMQDARRFDQVSTSRRVINGFERSRSLHSEIALHPDLVSERMKAVCEAGYAFDGETYLAACRDVDRLRVQSQLLFDDIELLISPATNGEAPRGLAATGDPAFQEIWTMLRHPVITIPNGVGAEAMPIGLQLIGARYHDRQLLAYADEIASALIEE
jgi:Asp-tRNA(Asn)/Glu-tRNA(Gln) amidotransferase A subunit family amidase